MIAIATAGSIVSALASALTTVRRLNVELEDRVEAKTRELAASWARTAELERERAIATERERMMRDMHDGTGGQLVSALSLVESGEYRGDDLAETLRAALADLRLSIDSLEAGPPDLLAVLVGPAHSAAAISFERTASSTAASAASARAASGPPACAMSGRPPPPLPPSASDATRTRSTAEKREVRSGVTPTTTPALPSSVTPTMATTP